MVPEVTRDWPSASRFAKIEMSELPLAPRVFDLMLTGLITRGLTTKNIIKYKKLDSRRVIVFETTIGWTFETNI